MKAENYNIPVLQRPSYKQSSPVVQNTKKYPKGATRDDIKTEKFADEYKVTHDAYAALLKSNRNHKYSMGSNENHMKKPSSDVKHVTDFIFGDDSVAREKKVAEIIHELKKTKYNESEDSIGVGMDESPYKQAIISESLNRFDNKIIMADPLNKNAKNLNNSLIHTNSIKEVQGIRSESPNVRPITEPKEGRKDLLNSGKQNLPSIQSKSGNNIKTFQVNISSMDERKFTPVRQSRNNEINTSTEKSLPYNQVMHPRCLSHRMLSRKEIEGANQSPPKNDKTTEDRFSTPIFSPAKVNPQGEYQIPLKPGEDNPKGNNIVRIQVGKKNTTVINHLLQIKPQIKKVVTDKKGAANASINKNQNVSLLNGAYNVSDSKVGVENFLFDKVIGQGSYAVVRLAVEKGGTERVAIKTYEKFKLFDAQRRKNVRREINLLQEIDHPNIIKLYKTVDTITQIHLIMEYAETQSLHTFLKSKPNRRLDEDVAKNLFKQVVDGIDYLHRKNIVHRDIKLENLMLTSENKVKIIDFGFSVKIPKDKTLGVFCGTPSYMAPELASKRDYYGHLADIWALGILLYVLLVGAFPMKGTDDKDLFKKIASGRFDIPTFLSKEAQGLIKKLLRMNPQDRPSTSDILHDEWLTGSQNSYRNLKDFLSNKIEEYKKIGTTSQIDEGKEGKDDDDSTTN